MLIIFPVKAALSSATPSEPCSITVGVSRQVWRRDHPLPLRHPRWLCSDKSEPQLCRDLQQHLPATTAYHMTYAPANASNTSTTPREVIDISLERGEVSIYAPSRQTPTLWTTTPLSLAWKAHHSSSQAHETASWPLATVPLGSSEPATLTLLWLDATHTARASTRHQVEHRAVGRGAAKPPSPPTLLPF
jgi:hypothetical protein